MEQEGELEWHSASSLGLRDGSDSPVARVGRVEDGREESNRREKP